MNHFKKNLLLSYSKNHKIVDPVARNPLAFSETFSPIFKDCKPITDNFRFSEFRKNYT